MCAEKLISCIAKLTLKLVGGLTFVSSQGRSRFDSCDFLGRPLLKSALELSISGFEN